MPIEVYELWNSRSVDVGLTQQSALIELFCRGTSDDELARAAVLAAIPSTFFGLQFTSVSIEPIGGLCWTAKVRYDSRTTETIPVNASSGQPSPSEENSAPETLPPGVSFDIGSVTETILSNRERIHTIVGEDGAGNPVDLSVLFNFDGSPIRDKYDGEVEGVETIRPTFEFSVPKTFSLITLAYARTINDMVGKTNDDTFWGWDAGEVLFLGASGTVKGKDNVEITFRFSVAKNEVNIDITDEFRAPTKKGHEFLWVRYGKQVNGDELRTVPTMVIVDRVYDTADFSLLGIGV